MEIDRELNKVEITGSEKKGVMTNKKEADSDIPNKDKEEKNKPSSSEGVPKSGASHMAILNENPQSITETHQPEEPRENSSCARKGQTLIRTWTRIARPAQESDEGGKDGIGSRAKQSLMEVDGCDVQKKRRSVPYNSKTNLPVVEVDGQPRQEQ